MEIITFDFIREIHRKERSKKGLELEELPENFFALVQIYLNEKEKLYEKTRNPEIILEIENAKKMIKEIIEFRQKKIVMSAMQVLRGAVPPEHMTHIEEEFFDKILSVLNEYKSKIELEITGDFVSNKIEEVKEELKQLGEEEIKKSFVEEVSESKEEERIEEEEGSKTEKDGEKSEEKENKEEEKDLKGYEPKKLKVIALTNIPKFVDENLNTYGPYKKGEEFELPEDIAKLLVSRKLVEEVSS